MAIQDHPRFAEYDAARVARDEAQQHLNEMSGEPGEELARRDLSWAQAAFNKIAVEIGDA